MRRDAGASERYNGRAGVDLRRHREPPVFTL